MQPTSQILKQLGGTAEDISRQLADFSQSARALSGDRPRFTDEHAGRWVAVYRGRVVATGDSLDAATRAAVAAGAPVEHTIIRHITRDEKAFFF